MSTLLKFEAKHVRPAALEPAHEAQSDIELLHTISTALIGIQDRVELYGKIVDAAIQITRSQFGTMQLLCPSEDPAGQPGSLQLLCSRGLPSDAVAFWQLVPPTAHSSCIQALKTGARAIIPDYEQWDQIAGTEELMAFRQTGIRSAQTTPLIARDGKLLGMISTHWAQAHTPSERDLRLLDILARQAADLLERTIAEEARREREKELERTCAALRQSEELQKMLTGELSHRVKNMLATVQSIATQTLRHSAEPAEFVESFGGRIRSMSRVHSQLSSNEWRGTRLRDVVEDQMKLGPVDESQIVASGPEVQLDATDVPKMAMILHELGTNSLKYGALSNRDGEVAIRWTLQPGRLELHWIERGGPRVEKPLRRGFGTRLIDASVRGAGGEARMTWDPAGIRWDIVYPLAGTASNDDGAALPNCGAGPAAARTQVAERDRTTHLAGKRILVVEDEPLLAMDISGQIEDFGATVVGPAADAAMALDLIERYRCDAALLDANLDGQPVDAIAAALARNNVPFIFVSGYDRSSLPVAFADRQLLPKPFNAEQLVDAAGTLLR